MSETELDSELFEFIKCAQWMEISISDFSERIAPLRKTLEVALKRSGQSSRRSIQRTSLFTLTLGTLQSL